MDGREFWINAWVKEGKKGKFFSGSIKAKDGEPLRQAARGGGNAPLAGAIDDDVPFNAEWR